MKIGILTLHRANNYGAVLQCYALQQALRNQGHDAWVIDYRQPDTETSYSPISKERIDRNISNPVALVKDLLLTPLYCKKAKGFDKFRDTYLHCTEAFNCSNQMPQDFDVYMIGSDQLWSIQCMGGHIEEVFFGKFPHPTQSRIMGYAISANEDSLNTIGVERLKQYVTNFDCISIREQGIADWIKKNVGCNVRIDIDPTLLLDPTEWEKISSTKRPIKRPYLLSYYLLPEQKPVARRLAKARGWRYVEMGYMAHSPAEFLTWVRHADCIVGGSFHIAVFSIIFKRNFVIVQKNSGFDIRSASLLNAVGLSNHFISIEKLPNVTFPNSTNYDKALAIISRQKQLSIDYIRNI